MPYDHFHRDLGALFRELASHRESQILDGHLKGDHIHMMISIPPTYAVSQVVGYIKGKRAIHIARNYQVSARILPVKIFGPGVIMSQLQGAMKKRFAPT